MPGQASEVAELRAAQRLCMQTLDAGCCYGIKRAAAGVEGEQAWDARCRESVGVTVAPCGCKGSWCARQMALLREQRLSHELIPERPA